MESQIFPNVTLGEGAIVHPPVVLGFPPRGREPGELPLVIGPGAVIRPFTTIYAGTTIGERFQSGQGASIREENTIGDGCSGLTESRFTSGEVDTRPRNRYPRRWTVSI